MYLCNKGVQLGRKIMAKKNLAPTSARILQHHARTIPTGPHAGQTVYLTLYEAEVSKGQRSNYKPVLTRWLRLNAAGLNQDHSWSYSGKRLHLAEQDLQAQLTTLDNAKV